MKIKFADIRIPYYMAQHEPKASKVHEHLQRFLQGADIAREIVVDQKGTLIDGYARYCALLLDGYQYIPDLVIIVTEKKCTRTYIKGKHRENGVEYLWRVRPRMKGKSNLKVGKYAMVNTHRGRQVVQITDVIESEDNLPVRVTCCVKKPVKTECVGYDDKLGYFLK